MSFTKLKTIVIVAVLGCLMGTLHARKGSLPSGVKEVAGVDSYGRKYFLYVPKTLDKGRRYHLVVGVHGTGQPAKGGVGILSWVAGGDCILLCPEFDYRGKMQYLRGDTDKQLIKLYEKFQKEYKLHKRMFIHGFSAGSQYAQRMGTHYPKLIAGYSAYAGGTWETNERGYGNFPTKSSDVVALVHCGANDKGKSFGQAPMGRRQWAEKYSQMLCKKGFIFKELYYRGLGHQMNRSVIAQAKEAYYLSTRGMTEQEAKSFDRKLAAVRRAEARGSASSVRSELQKLNRYQTKQLPKSSVPLTAPERSGLSKYDKSSGWYGPAGWKNKLFQRYINEYISASQ